MSIAAKIYDTDWSYAEKSFASTTEARAWILSNVQLPDYGLVTLFEDGVEVPQIDTFRLLLSRTDRVPTSLRRPPR
jgi:hypothetical protein